MKFYIGTDSGSGQEFNSKEAFLHELALMIDDCVANGGEHFDITVDADASCFDPEDSTTSLESDFKTIAEEIEEIGIKRAGCKQGYWGDIEDSYSIGYFCNFKKQFVTGTDCLHCKFTKS